MYDYINVYSKGHSLKQLKTIRIRNSCSCQYFHCCPFDCIALSLELCGACSRSVYCSSASRSDRETSGDVVVVQSTKYGYSPMSRSQAGLLTRRGEEVAQLVRYNQLSGAHSPLDAGAFFMDTTSVAIALSTKEISERRNLKYRKFILM